MTDDPTALHVPAQVIPPPNSLSPQARAFLANAAKRIAAASAAAKPAGGSSDQKDEAAAALQILRPMASRFQGTAETIELPHGAKLYRMTPATREGRRAEVVYFDIHGGGFTAGGGEMCQVLAKLRAADYGVVVYAVDYRLAPEHPYPAALDDVMAAYKAILAQHSAANLIVGGSSAGGNLAAALMLRARDEGLPRPIALLLLTPGLDMTRSGDTYRTNRYLDVNLHGGAEGGPSSYAGTADLKQPYLSPIYGEIDKAWPPTILVSGTRDLLLSDTVRMHRAIRRAGVTAELHVTEAGPHGGFMGTAPEDLEIMGECRRFMYAAWGVQA